MSDIELQTYGLFRELTRRNYRESRKRLLDLAYGKSKEAFKNTAAAVAEQKLPEELEAVKPLIAKFADAIVPESNTMDFDIFDFNFDRMLKKGDFAGVIEELDKRVSACGDYTTPHGFPVHFAERAMKNTEFFNDSKTKYEVEEVFADGRYSVHYDEENGYNIMTHKEPEKKYKVWRNGIMVCNKISYHMLPEGAKDLIAS